jgi:hypothetical protein
VLLGGLLRVLFWGALCFVVVPVAANAAWSAGSDALHQHAVNGGAVVGLVVAFTVVFGILAAVLLVRFADGAVRTWRGVADLRRTRIVEGPVVKAIGVGRWFAVDPGHVDHVRAWHPGVAPLPPRGATVRATVTPHLCFVSALDVVAPPPAPTPAGTPTTGVAPTPPPATPTAPAAVRWSAPPAERPTTGDV